MGEHIKYKLQLIIDDNVYLSNKYETVLNIFQKAELEISKNINQLNDSNIEVKPNESKVNENVNKEENSKKEDPNIEGESKINDNILKDEKIPQKYKKLFRQIVIKTHPDKHPPNINEEEKLKYLNIYHNITKDFEEKKYYNVLKYAIKLGIDIDLSDFTKEIDGLKNNNKILENEINIIQNSILWEYFMMEDGNLKEKRLEEIVSNLKNNIVS